MAVRSFANSQIRNRLFKALQQCNWPRVTKLCRKLLPHALRLICSELAPLLRRHNRLPSRANENNKSPYEMRYGSPPNICHLRPFGIDVFVRVQTHITKVMPRATKGIMLGYGHTISNQRG